MREYLEDFAEQVDEHFWDNWHAIRNVCEPLFIFHDHYPYNMFSERKVGCLEKTVSTIAIGVMYAAFASAATLLELPYIARHVKR